MKPKWTGWKEGVLTEDLLSYGGIWTGKYEWHYLNLENYNLVRTKKLLIKNK